MIPLRIPMKQSVYWDVIRAFQHCPKGKACYMLCSFFIGVVKHHRLRSLKHGWKLEDVFPFQGTFVGYVSYREDRIFLTDDNQAGFKIFFCFCASCRHVCRRKALKLKVHSTRRLSQLEGFATIDQDKEKCRGDKITTPQKAARCSR